MSPSRWRASWTAASARSQSAQRPSRRSCTLRAPFRAQSVPACRRGENKTVVATVKPKSSGELSLGAAEVSYQSTAEGGRQVRAHGCLHRCDPSDSAAPAQTGYSTQPSGYVVETERAHRKRTAIHYWEWTFYAVAAGLAVGLPGTAYQQQGS